MMKKSKKDNESRHNIFLFLFAIGIILLLVIISFYFFVIPNVVDSGVINLQEILDLDAYYDSDVKWYTNSSNIKLNNNVVTAITNGDAYLYAKRNNKKIYRLKLKVLTGNEAFSLDEHFFHTTVHSNKKINIVKNYGTYINDNIHKSFFARIGDFFMNIYYSLFPSKKKDYSFMNSSNHLYNVEEDNPDTVDSDDYEQLVDYSFVSLDERIATVDASGNIVAVSPGKTKILVEDSFGNKDSYVIYVEPDNIIFYQNDYELTVGNYVTIDYFLISNIYNKRNIRWKSSNDSIVSISEDGVVYAHKVGKVTITGVVGDTVCSFNVSVSGEKFSSNLSLKSDSISLNIGDALELPIKSNDRYNVISENPAIATIENGKVIGKSEGKTFIYVTTAHGITKSIEVDVKKKEISVEKIIVDRKNLSMYVDGTRKLHFTMYPAGVSNKSVNLEYDNEYISIDDNFNITALKKGKTSIIITSSNGKKEKVIVDVLDVSPKKLYLNEEKLVLKSGDTDLLSTTLEPSNVTDSNVLWSSSDSSIVSISSDGKIEALKEGKAIIKASSIMDSSIFDTCEVEVVSNEISSYSIIFDGNGSTSGDMEEVKCNFNDDCSLPSNNFVKSGYVFEGWSTIPNGLKIYDNEQVVKKVTTTSNVVLYAVWSPFYSFPKSTSVYYDCNGGIGNSNAKFVVDTNNQVLSNDCKKDDSVLVSWNTEKDGTGKDYSINSKISNTWIYENYPKVTLYAQWIKKKASVLIQYDCNGGEGDIQKRYSTFLKNQSFSSSCVRDGFQFLGWSNEKDSKEPIYSKGDSVTDTWIYENAPRTILYAVWERKYDDKKINVNFQCNGGDGGGSQTFSIGKKEQKFTTTCKRDGYKLVGWNRKMDGSSNGYDVSYFVDDEWIYNSDSEVTLYAQWVKDYGDPVVVFLPSQTKDIKSDEAILLRSEDGSLALIDTSHGSLTGFCGKLVQYIRKYALVSNGKEATLDYLFISHSHPDHVSCMNYLFDSNIKINNIVIKRERQNTRPYNWASSYVSSHPETNLITVNQLEEDTIYPLGENGTKQLKMHVFNTKDVYSDEDECFSDSGRSTAAPSFKFTTVGNSQFEEYDASNRFVKTKKGFAYIPFANTRKISYTKSFIKRHPIANGSYQYYYALKEISERPLCDPNSNSVALLVEVPVKKNDERFIYIPSDLQNNGYPFTGDVCDKFICGKKVVLTGNHNYFTENAQGNLVFNTSIAIQKPQEYLIAKMINDKYDRSKIVVYQASHHGYNVDPSSINLLNFNRIGFPVVMTKTISQEKLLNSQNQRTYFYSVDKSKKYYTGEYYDSEGVKGTLEFFVNSKGKVRINAVKP